MKSIALFYILVSLGFLLPISNANMLPKYQKQIIIVDRYSKIESIPQLLKAYRGKPVLLDLWATWCEPCLETFKTSATTDSFLLKKGIALVYISLDPDSLDQKWRETIQQYHLFGNHIRANKALKDALSLLIWGSKDVYSIPHYMLYSKTGSLLTNDVPEPSKKVIFENYVKRQLANQ
jgi:thiol-disulfide isomerase/thioredoxin